MGKTIHLNLILKKKKVREFTKERKNKKKKKKKGFSFAYMNIDSLHVVTFTSNPSQVIGIIKLYWYSWFSTDVHLVVNVDYFKGLSYSFCSACTLTYNLGLSDICTPLRDLPTTPLTTRVVHGHATPIHPHTVLLFSVA